MSGTCYEEADWLAFLDDEVKADERSVMARHAENCGVCAARIAQVADLFSWGEQRLSVVPESERETDALRQGVRQRRRRRTGRTAAWRLKVFGSGAAVIVAAAAVIAPGPHVWADFLHVFRASHINAVQVTQSEMANLQNALTQQGKVSLKHYFSVDTVKPMVWRQGTVSGYAAQAGLPDLWPKSLGVGKQVNVQTLQPAQYVFRLNVANLNALVQSFGGTHLFPASLNTTPITVNTPSSVDITSMTSGRQMTGYVLQESGLPSVSIPSGAGLSQARQALQALPFLPQPIEQALAGTANWQNTVIVPVQGAVTQNVSFLGHHAELIAQTYQLDSNYTLVWDNGQVIASFSQTYTGTLSAAQFLQHAKELFG